MEESVFGRLMAFTIVIIAMAALIVRAQLSAPDHGGDVGLAMWELMRYFTILTNALVAIFLAFHLLHEPQSASRLAGVTLAIGIVGVVYHLLLANLNDLVGIEILVDHALHTIVPLMMFLWWAGFAPKTPLSPLSPIRWILWPVWYAVYAVLRGMMDGQYPYFFLNLDELGWEGLGLSIAQFLVAFLIAGYALYAVAVILQRYSDNPG
ncbi:MAG: Pr6Pr family membrane protein [Dinoroseobacter sp.]|nr:Pr6Pr family membrane protein [Dinoroseobacter sp.]